MMEDEKQDKGTVISLEVPKISKRAIKTLKIWSLVMFLVFLSVSFVHLELNPIAWDAAARVIFVMVMLVSAFACIIYVSDSD